ncbi:putative oxidoreductase [Colletotrichum trifolii]|uniref:Putative oxidoreductase n=1 Tax=Colletotrichum trifolii TaxID=5466 RepID=A0A4V3HXP9_COLTR|nr:putative oxidoreductase [Colletotrichum trifolii]
MALASFYNMRTQWFPPVPTFTENEVLSQNGRVFIVTGGNAGVGFELVKMLYTTGATIYMASRSKDKADKAIESITNAKPAPENPGNIKFLHLDLNDLENVKSAASVFAQQESRLDILWNNAGTGALGVEVGARTKQGFEPMIGMHCIAAQLFTTLLLPQLRVAVSTASKGSVRVVWTSSFLGDSASPANGIDFSVLENGTSDRTKNYAVSKVGNWLLGHEMALRYGSEGIVSVTQNPGNLKAGSYAGTPAVAMLLINRVLHDPKYGGYTELYAGLSPDISLKNNGAYVIPWGRIRPAEDCPRKDILKALETEANGGLGYAAKFWDWCEEKSRPAV